MHVLFKFFFNFSNLKYNNFDLTVINQQAAITYVSKKI